MDTKNLELSKTGNALADLNEALIKLNAVISAKKNELSGKDKKHQADLKEKEEKLDNLKASSEQIVGQIDGMINKLDKVLENDGTSNNND